MRVPVLTPALMRNQRSRLVRPFGRAGASGIRPSQYEGGEGESGGEEAGGEEEENGASGEEGGAGEEVGSSD